MSAVAEPKDKAWRQRLHIPNYRIGEAARYARIAPQTVAAWHAGGVRQTLSPKEGRTALSYLQLIEVAVVAAARGAGVKLSNIRAARAYVSAKFNSKHPFAEYRFKTDGQSLFMEFSEIDGAASADAVLRPDHGGQLAWRAIIGRLEEFEYDDIVLRWHVMGPDSAVVIDPRIAFGKPAIKGTSTWILKGRAATGESIAGIAEDFGLEEDDVLAAIDFESADTATKSQRQWTH